MGLFCFTFSIQAQDFREFLLPLGEEYRFEFVEPIQVSFKRSLLAKDGLKIESLGRQLFIDLRGYAGENFRVETSGNSGGANYILSIQTSPSKVVKESNPSGLRSFVLPPSASGKTAVSSDLVGIEGGEQTLSARSQTKVRGIADSLLIDAMRQVIFSSFPDSDIDGNVPNLRFSIFPKEQEVLGDSVKIHCHKVATKDINACVATVATVVDRWVLRVNNDADGERGIVAYVVLVSNPRGEWQWNWLSGNWLAGVVLTRRGHDTQSQFLSSALNTVSKRNKLAHFGTDTTSLLNTLLLVLLREETS